MAAPSSRWRYGLPAGVPLVPPPRRRVLKRPPDAIDIAKTMQRQHRDKLDEQWQQFAEAEPRAADMFVHAKARFGQLYLTPRNDAERRYTWRALDFRLARGEQIRLLRGKELDEWLALRSKTTR